MLDHSPLLSDVPGLRHGFSNREGGASSGRYATLNLGGRWGDDAAAVTENHARVAAAGGYAVEQLRRVRQVHGNQVLGMAELRPDSEADALWCGRGDHCVASVMTADCVPVLLADREGTVAAAVHSGWRGTVANIVGAAVGALARAGAEPGSVVAAIGPCIELAAFEVGQEVAEQFPAQFVDRARWPSPHVDLVAMVREQLAEAGVPAASVDRVGACTHANPSQWYSYRRDGAGIGQMLAFAGYPT